MYSKFFEKVHEKLSDASLIYVTIDPERALGLETQLPQLKILCGLPTQYPQFLREDKLVTVTSDDFTSSRSLFRTEEYGKLTEFGPKSVFIQVFKNSPVLERYVTGNGWRILAASAQAAAMFEHKLTQAQLLEQAGVALPQYQIVELAKTDYFELKSEFSAPFVLQFNRGHTGNSTYIIRSDEELTELKRKFPKRQARISEYIPGETFTVNAVVFPEQVFCGGLSLQIPGNVYTDIPETVTMGNDFEYPSVLDSGQISAIITTANRIGALMARKGFKGLFGFDFKIHAGKIIVIEINARQTASVPFYTAMQLENNKPPLALLHLLAFFQPEITELDANDYSLENIQPLDYAQIFIRSNRKITIRNQQPMGFYRLQGDNAAIDRYTDYVDPNTVFLDEDRDKALLFQKAGYKFTGENDQRILLLTPVSGREIEPGSEIARIQLKQGIMLSSNQIKPWLKEAAHSLFNRMI